MHRVQPRAEPVDRAWRAVLSAGTALGCGFLAAPGRVLTCADAVGKARSCRVAFPASGRTVADCALELPGRGGDLACVRVPARPGEPTAPLGPAERPPLGALVELLGLPGWHDLGRRVRARVTENAGARMRIEPLGTVIGPCFRGGAAVDAVTGLVVGLLAGRAGRGTGWLVPLDVVTAAFPWLRPRCADPLRADHGFQRALTALARRSYPEALHHLGEVQWRHPDAADVYYYRALAMLRGLRPGCHAAGTVGDVQHLLGEALRHDPGARHAAALLAVVREDWVSLRGGPAPALPAGTPAASAGPAIAPRHAREIVLHVPAAECLSWRLIRRQLSSAVPG